jgi:hypothetical protein
MPNTEQRWELVDLIEETWEKYPGYRLGQLISNVIGDEVPFFITDSKLTELLEKYPSVVPPTDQPTDSGD